MQDIHPQRLTVTFIMGFQIEKEIDMPEEKNIIVNRGIPMTPSVSGPNSGRYNSFSPGAGAGHYGDDHHGSDTSFAYFGERENREQEIQSAYTARLATIPQVIETEFAAVRALGDTSEVAPVAALTRELGVRDTLIAGKTAEAAEQQKIADAFYGVDPTTKTLDDWVNLYNQFNRDPAALLAEWTASYTAAYTAKFINEEINVLNTQSAGIRESLAAAQAVEAEQARIADEAATAEAARVAAEAEAKRVADEAAAAEAARVAAEAEAARVAAEAAEQTRLAAEAEAKRIADEAAAAEAARLAAEAEAARLAAEAEAKRIADEAAAAEAARVAAEQAEQARLAEAIRIANTFRAPGAASVANPLFVTSSGVVAVADATASLLAAAIRSAVVALVSAVAGSVSSVAVGVFGLLAFPEKLANGELPDRYSFSTPLSDLAPGLSAEQLQAAATAGSTVELPVRISSKTAVDGQSEVFVVKTDGVTVPSSVRVVAATYDAAQNVYSVTTGDTPPRTLTWTPIVNPGNSTTTSPAEQPDPPVYTGATITPVDGRIDTFPSVAEASFDDFILINPADSNFVPIYVMFRDRREDAGVATGTGQPTTGIWLGTASRGEGAPIPSQIADQLRGKEFKNFREFRETFWKAVANDPDLSKQFSSVNLARMKNKGYAPYVIPSEQVGGKAKFELHHVVFLKNNGELYGLDNLRVVTPKEHDALHSQKAGE